MATSAVRDAENGDDFAASSAASASASRPGRSPATRRPGSRSCGATAAPCRRRRADPGARHRRRQHRVRGRRAGGRARRSTSRRSGLGPPDRAAPALRPAAPEELEALTADADAGPSRPRCRSRFATARTRAIAVAGTATSLAAIDLRARALRPRAGPRIRARARPPWSASSPASPRFPLAERARSPGSTPTERRRSSPGVAILVGGDARVRTRRR